MMNEIRILKTEALRDFEDNFSIYRKDSNKIQNIMLEQSVGSGIYFKKPNLDSKSDFNSAKVLFKSLNKLNTVMASDERLWVYLFYTVFNDYRIKRLQVQYPKEQPDDKKLKSNTLFTGNNNDKVRAKFLNYLSRLWWAGYFTDGEEELLHLLTDSDFSGKMTGYFSSTLTSVKSIRIGTLRAIVELQEILQSQDIKYKTRDLLIRSNQYLNAMSSAVVLDIYSEKEIKDLVLSHLSSKYKI